MTAKILLVDDAIETTRLLEKVLSKAGYQVQLAHDGEEGLRQAFAFQPDLIVLDVMMPGMDGWSTLRQAEKPWRFERK